MESLGYQAVLKEGLLKIYDATSVFIQDGATCHTSKSTSKYLEKEKVCVMSDWPPQSPDLNIIENIWSTIKRNVGRHNPQSANDLWTYIQEEWENISTSDIGHLYDSIPRRLKAVLLAKGSQTKY